jgi:hypothetical protein
MELFTAGDDAQWTIIKRWIESSDIYMLLAAGRYGSLHPRTRRSYTHMEYAYAKRLKKPMFALIASPQFLNAQITSGQLDPSSTDFASARTFRELLQKRIVNFFDNRDQVKTGILRALAEISNRDGLAGWVRGSLHTAPEDLHLLFPRTWQVGHGLLPDIENKHNYRALATLVADDSSAVLRIGSPHLYYWADPPDQCRLEWFLANTTSIRLELALFKAMPHLTIEQEAKRRRVLNCLLDVQTRFTSRVAIADVSRCSDLSYIIYPLQPDQLLSRAMIGLQTTPYQDRPFLEFVFSRSSPPPLINAVLSLHAEEMNRCRHLHS